MNSFVKSNVALRMSLKASPREIKKIVDRLQIIPAEEIDVTAAQEVRVAAVQLLLKPYTTLADYVTHMNSYVADAVNNRAQIICFPAFAGLLPALFMPQMDAVLHKLRPEQAGALPDASALGDCLAYFSDPVFEVYFHTMSTLAARHRVCIMAGSTLYFEDTSLRHRALLFDRNGDLSGYQDKVSLTPLERDLGLEAAAEIKVFPSPAGSVAMLIGSDANYYETARVARNLGADILLHPTAFLGEYTPVHSTLGLNMRVQENNLWGVQSIPIGDTGLGFAAEGYCCIFGPVELTRSRNGTVARSSGRLEPDILCVTLSLERLAQAHNPYRQGCNKTFLKRYIDRLY